MNVWMGLLEDLFRVSAIKPPHGEHNSRRAGYSGLTVHDEDSIVAGGLHKGHNAPRLILGEAILDDVLAVGGILGISLGPANRFRIKVTEEEIERLRPTMRRDVTASGGRDADMKVLFVEGTVFTDLLTAPDKLTHILHAERTVQTLLDPLVTFHDFLTLLADRDVGPVKGIQKRLAEPVVPLLEEIDQLLELTGVAG